MCFFISDRQFAGLARVLATRLSARRFAFEPKGKMGVKAAKFGKIKKHLGASKGDGLSSSKKRKEECSEPFLASKGEFGRKRKADDEVVEMKDFAEDCFTDGSQGSVTMVSNFADKFVLENDILVVI